VPIGCLRVVGFEGARAAVERESARAFRLLAEAGAQDRGPGPGEAWHQNRHAVSFKQSKVFLAGAFVDTMEISTTWDRLPALYRRVRAAVSPLAFVMAHFSHAYREGCSIYFTFAARAGTPADAERRHEELWETGLSAVARAGGSISHHHGVGIAKREFLPDEHGAGGAALFDALKQAFDPDGVMNPGKLWRAPGRAGEDLREPAPPDAIGTVEPAAQTVRVAGAAPLAELTARLGAEGWTLPWWLVGVPGDLSVATALASPERLDWGPRFGPLATNLLAVDGTARGGHRLRQTPAARRAAGPDLAALFVGAGRRFGHVDAAVLRVVGALPAPLPLAWRAAGPGPLLDGLRALVDADAPPWRATLAWTPADGFTATLLVEGRGVELPPLPDGVAVSRPDPDDPWRPELPADGFRRAVPLPRRDLAVALAAAAVEGLPLAVGRLDDHGGWLVPLPGAPADTLVRLAARVPALAGAAAAAATAAGAAAAELADRVGAALVPRLAPPGAGPAAFGASRPGRGGA
jgi:hypothetical protein